ncbi:MAG: hypothetical protein LUH43_04510 [Clostridia bacterium]|nr:hypothetical protein [Clostridia bacterium]
MPGAGFSDICGCGELIARTVNDIKNDRIGHAYIIDGNDADSVYDFALDFAAAVLCTGEGMIPCGRCPSCMRLEAGSHPDVMIIERGERASVGVDKSRMMREDAAIIPSESERKIYIVRDAEKMTASAENALLLSLEEPPSYVLYLLLTTDISSLLPTVRSRASAIHMRAPTKDETLDFVKRTCGSKFDGGVWDEIYLLSGGSPRLAAEYVKNEKKLAARLAEKSKARELLAAMLSGGGGAYSGVYRLGRMKSDTAMTLLSDMKCALRDMIAAKRSASAENVFYKSRSEALSAGGNYSAAGLMRSLDCVTDAEEMIKSNVSPTAAMMALAVGIKNSVYSKK